MGVTFKKKNKTSKTSQYIHQVHDVWDIKTSTVDDTRQQLDADPSSVTMSVVRTPQLRSITPAIWQQLQMAIGTTELPLEEVHEVLDANFKSFFDPETDQLKPDISG